MKRSLFKLAYVGCSIFAMSVLFNACNKAAESPMAVKTNDSSNFAVHNGQEVTPAEFAALFGTENSVGKSAAVCDTPADLAVSVDANNLAVATWSSVGDAELYGLQVRINNNNIKLFTTTNLTLSGTINPAASYEIRVIARCVGGELASWSAWIPIETTTTGLHAAFAEFNSDSYDIYLDDDEVVLETNGYPNHTSPYWSNTTARTITGPMGQITTPAADENHPLFSEPIATSYENMAPGNIDNFNGSYTLRVPVSPQLANSSSSTGLGSIGLAVSGATIYNDEEGPNVPLDNAVGSLDYNGAHTGPQSYHYHLEPKAWSNDDDALIGIMSDGFFLYGRKCNSTGTYPTGLDASGGHTSTTQHTATAEYHYHIENELYLNEYYILFPGDYQGTPNGIQ